MLPPGIFCHCAHRSPGRRRGLVRVTWVGVLLMLLALPAVAPAQETPDLAPASDLVVEDEPNDAGTGLRLRWKRSAQDRDDASPRVIRGYRLVRMVPPGEVADPRMIDLSWGTEEYVDETVTPNKAYSYVLLALGEGTATSAPIYSAEVRPVVQWFHHGRWTLLIVLTFVCAAVLVSTELAKRGWTVKIRRIAALDAMEEAVGRATETGRPLIFVPGIMDLNELDTVAGVTILSHVARTAAEYDTPLEVPNTRTLVMNAARETLQAAALAAGRPDWYEPERAYYVTEEQFAFVAYMVGWMQRNKPAACFFLGRFYAESLLLAEAGNAAGAIQIAGTAETTQLPFFVAACDYTLLGDELFAASAYLSGEPQQLGILRGGDCSKLLAMVLVLGTSLYATIVQFF